MDRRNDLECFVPQRRNPSAVLTITNNPTYGSTFQICSFLCFLQYATFILRVSQLDYSVKGKHVLNL